MSGDRVGFLLWAAVGLSLIGLGKGDFFARKPAGFWANTEPPQVTDTRKYNAAVGWLLIAFGAVFILLGLPLLFPGREMWILLSIPGVMIAVIAMMVVYTQCIEKKYGKK